MQTSRIVATTVLASVVALLSGCGQKGPLTLPETPPGAGLPVEEVPAPPTLPGL